MKRRSGLGFWLALAACLALIAGGAIMAGVTWAGNKAIADYSAPQVTSTFGAGPDALASGSVRPPAITGETLTPQQVSALGPNRLVIPSVGINAPVVQTHKDAQGVLVIPNPSLIGHWDQSAGYTANDGAIVLAGHVDDVVRNAGAMEPIVRLKPGAVVWVTDAADKPHKFVVVSLHEYVKQDLPASVFTSDGPLRMSLITCSGPIIRTGPYTGHYRDNTVAQAVPAS